MFSAAFCSFRPSIATALVFLALTLVSPAQMPDLPPRSTPPPPSVPRTDNPSTAPETQNENAPQPQPGTSQQPGGQESITPERANDQMFVFKKQVEEVVLHATVLDDQRHLVPNLDKSAFSVYERGVPQTITSFRHEDVPVAMGIVIDNSGSMRDKREKVNQ